MGYDGWLEYNGIEVVNLSRTAQLAEALGIDTVWNTPESVAWIQTALGGVGYNDISEAPWYDPGYPASSEFAGIVPLAFTGLDDSTMESTPVEYITDGGHSGKPRNATLPLVANVAIIASTPRGADFGKRWMDRVFRSGADERAFCSGSDLRYFRWPSVDSPIAHRRDVRQTRGTSVTRKRNNHCSATWTATFTLTAADPFEYSDATELLDGLGAEVPTNAPWLRLNYADRPNVDDGAGWLTAVTDTTPALDTVAPLIGTVSAQYTYTGPSAASVGAGFELRPASGVAYWPVTAGEWLSVYLTAGVSAGTRFVQFESDFYADTTTTFPVGSPAVAIEEITAGSPERFGFSVQVPVGATTMRIVGFVGDIGGSIATGEVLRLDGLVIERRSTNDGLATYWDGDTAPIGGMPFAWDGIPGQSRSYQYDPSTVPAEFGTVTLVETECPVYDYTPVYDPLFPALVPAPAPPDFYPSGWTIVDGSTFDRFWAKVPVIEPTYLDVVPVITLTTTVEARMVRIGIWEGDHDPNDQCGDLLFGAVVTYLPAGVDFVIDGEQKASYVWDGASPSVRRSDSLVYSFDAKPVDWTKFNDPSSLLITLDIFSDSEGVEGEGQVRAAVSFVQKSD